MKSDTSITHLTKNQYIDPETGELHVHYYWKRNKASKVEITGKLPDRLSGLTLIYKDLESSLKWVKQARALVPEDIKVNQSWNYKMSGDREVFDQIKALFVAALTFYGKCFTEANGRSAQVSRNWLSKEFKELHDYYMNFRHNFAAHSGDSKVELAKTFVLLHPRKKELIPITPTARLQPDIVFSFNDKSFEDLLIYVSDLVNEKYNKLVVTIVNELILVEKTEFWIQKAKQGKPVELGLPKKKS